MASEGPLSPGTVASVDSGQPGDLAWSNPGNATASDDARATITGGLGDFSEWLQATNFGFAIPTGATIDGIVVEVEKSGAIANAAEDTGAKIVKAGTITGTDKLISGQWSTTEAYVTYGSSSDLWGTTWTAVDINNSGFGFAIRCEDTAGNALRPRVDHIRITVYYTEAGNPWYAYAQQ